MYLGTSFSYVVKHGLKYAFLEGFDINMYAIWI